MAINLKQKQKTNLHVLIAEITVGIAASIFAVWTFFVLTYGVFNQQADIFDTVVTYLIQMTRSPHMTEFMHVVTMLGGPAILVLGIITALVLTGFHHTRRMIMFLAMLCSGIAINLLLKYIFQRPRPTMSPLVDEYFYSYPSGHAMNSFIFYMFIAYLLYHYGHNKKIGILALIFSGTLVLLIGISRVYLGVHYPTDVIAGYIGGLWWLVTVIVVEKIVVFGGVGKRGKK